MYIVKHLGAYYVSKFECGGVVLMIEHSDQRNDAKVFNTKEDIKKEMENVGKYDYEIEEA